jgi:alkylation response protein AidB-like acyl-CoA dehydrogenase
MLGPTIIAHGTDEQKQRHLGPMLHADEVWCQLFSEPAAGSDLAGIQSRAKRQDDGSWILNGQKVWTTNAQFAAFGLLLARTDADVPKHKGLTMFIVDMHQPGVEVRPIRSMAGASGFNEVFFTDARLPDEWRVGEIGEGWSVANATLMNERVAIGGDAPPRGSGPIAGAVAAYQAATDPSPADRDRLMRIWIEAELLRLGGLRAQALRSKGVPGPEGSVLKLLQGRLSQDISEFVVDMLGASGMLCTKYTGARGEPLSEPDPVIAFVASPASTIAGGSNDIQRNIIGDRVLGLPREPGFDPNTPWSQIPRS